MTPTGSCPRIRPGLTGYSPRTMCTSVPQMVVVVMRMTASPTRGIGLGTSSTAIRSLPLKTTAFIVFMTASPLEVWPNLSQIDEWQPAYQDGNEVELPQTLRLAGDRDRL